VVSSNYSALLIEEGRIVHDELSLVAGQMHVRLDLTYITARYRRSVENLMLPKRHLLSIPSQRRPIDELGLVLARGLQQYKPARAIRQSRKCSAECQQSDNCT